MVERTMVGNSLHTSCRTAWYKQFYVSTGFQLRARRLAGADVIWTAALGLQTNRAVCLDARAQGGSSSARDLGLELFADVLGTAKGVRQC